MPTRRPPHSAPLKRCGLDDCDRPFRALDLCGYHLHIATDRILEALPPEHDTVVCGGVWIEDVEFMLSTGCTWEQVCARVERKAGALEQGLKRAGRPDLTARLKLASERVLVGAA